jgi:leucyl-tRNA synthetase
MTEAYDFRRFEEKWQRIWEDREVFTVHEDNAKTKYYCLEMYPYPSGRIHMGHVRNYSIVDVIARFKFMKGLNVLHPIGWDAFGMPAENAAIEQGVHPRKWTLDNIAHMKMQLKKLGLSYDWTREVTTCLPEYYRWNQWIFLKLYEKGLAFRKESVVNWCPHCQTVLANEQVINDQCWRCDSGVGHKKMEQWYLKITDYAQELLDGLEQLEKWPEHVVTMQKNWIGKSFGAQVTFPLADLEGGIEVFTTRIDTIYGATFMVLSPEHPLTERLVTDSGDRERIQNWIARRTADLGQKGEPGEQEKEGIDTGKKALNPFTREEIPIWVANYVLMEYGTGAIMAVPAHDQRDFEFARKYGLKIRDVIVPLEEEADEAQEGLFEAYGRVINSGPFSDLPSQEAMRRMAAFAQEKGFGEEQTLYRLRDWGISRQRYWGTPIPIIYCDTCGAVPVPFEELPVTLPEEVEFQGEEGSPLETSESFVRTACPRCQGEARRETDTMDTFFDSSWYYFRYCSPQEKALPFQADPVSHWMPVDIYVGGVEHAILHLIYARFFCKILRDLGLTAADEPFPHYLPQGMVIKDGFKMSKSKGNVVDPDDMIQRHGSDALRLFMLFASPPEKEFDWDDKGIEGTYRFLNRLWSFFMDNAAVFQSEEPLSEAAAGGRPAPLLVKTHQTIKKVTGDIEKRYHLNTAVSSLMEFFNQMKRDSESLKADVGGRRVLKGAMETLLLLLCPFAPFLSEELWERMGHKDLASLSPWPEFDPALAQEDTVTIVVQVNGKIRERFEVARDRPAEEVKKKALELERIQVYTADKEPKKIVYIPNKLINIVV